MQDDQWVCLKIGETGVTQYWIVHPCFPIQRGTLGVNYVWALSPMWKWWRVIPWYFGDGMQSAPAPQCPKGLHIFAHLYAPTEKSRHKFPLFVRCSDDIWWHIKWWSVWGIIAMSPPRAPLFLPGLWILWSMPGWNLKRWGSSSSLTHSWWTPSLRNLGCLGAMSRSCCVWWWAFSSHKLVYMLNFAFQACMPCCKHCRTMSNHSWWDTGA